MIQRMMHMAVMFGGVAHGASQSASKAPFVADAAWVANEYVWMVAVVSFALCAVVMDVFVLGEPVKTFQSFDTDVDDLLAGNGTRIRRDQWQEEF